MASTLQITSAPPLLAIPAIDDEKMAMPLPEPESIRLAICANLEESGEATRALALARQIRDGWTGGRAIQITFLSCGSIYEPIIMEENFPIMHCEPRTERGGTAEGPKWKFPETAGTEQMACRYIRGQLKGLQQLRPDVVLHGMWPFGSIAARMLGLRTILFIPLPLHKACVSSGLVRDIPDETSLLARLPRRVRKVFAKVGSRLMMRNSMFHQASLGWAAYYSGWSRPGPMSLFDAVQADLTLITDLPSFHSGYSLPSNFIMTGPIYSEDEDAAYNGLPDEVDPEIVAHMLRDGRPVVLVMMGSMSNPEVLFETIRAVTPCRDPAGTPDMWNVLVVASPALCRSSVARSVAAGDPRVMVTDRFLPGPSVNELADVVVCHGGQGTIQTALSVGTPLVGVAMQLEQQINLDHVMDAGAGIRIQRQQWNADNIRAAVKKVIMDVNYQRAAVNLAMKMGGLNGARNAAVHIGEFIRRSV